MNQDGKYRSNFAEAIEEHLKNLLIKIKKSAKVDSEIITLVEKLILDINNGELSMPKAPVVGKDPTEGKGH